MEQAIEFFTRVGTSIEIVEMEAWKFIAHHPLRDGRWLHFRDFMNPALTQNAFSAG